MNMRPLRMISGTEIVDKGKNVTNCILPEVGTKEVTPNGTWLEAKQIQTALEARKTLVAVERIDKLGALSHAEWRDQLQLAEVTQQVGGYWQYLGHKVNGTLFLLPEEALYLIETNCLLLKHNHVTVSLQKAYSLLLNNHMPLMKYKVYASLSRVGYKVFRHDKSKPTADFATKPDKLLKENKIVKMDTDDGNVNISANIDLTASDESINNSKSSEQPIQNIDISINKKTDFSILSPHINPNDNITSGSGMPSGTSLPPDSNMSGNDSNKTSDKKSKMSSDSSLPPDGKVTNYPFEIAIELPLPIIASDTPLPDGNDSNKSDETITLPIPSCDDISNKKLIILSNIPLPTDVNVNKSLEMAVDLQSNNNTDKEFIVDSTMSSSSSDKALSKYVENYTENVPTKNQNSTIFGIGLVTTNSEVLPSIDEHGVIRLGTKEVSADIEMKAISSSNTSKLHTEILDAVKRNTDSNKPRLALNIYKAKQLKIKGRKIQPSDPKIMQELFKNIPDCYNQQVITVKVPSEDYLPRNIFLNYTTYVLNLKTLISNRRRHSTSLSIENRPMHRAIRNSSESERAAVPTPELPQYLPNTPLFQQPFAFYPTWRPRFQPFHQRPQFPRHNFNQHPYFYRIMHFIPQNVNADRPRGPWNRNQMNQRKRQWNVKDEHLQAIKDFAQRLKQFSTPPNNSLNSLMGLMRRFNEIYNESIKITPNLNVIDENQANVETIEIDDDEEQIKKPRLDTDKFDKYLGSIRSLAARLKNFERKSQPSSKQRRAFCNLLKNFNKAFDAEFLLDAKGKLVDKKLVVIDSSSDSDAVATDAEKTKLKKRSADTDTDTDTTKTKKRKILPNPFNILKNINEGAGTSKTDNGPADIPVKNSRELLKKFDKNWLPNDDEFGSATLCSETDALCLLTNSQQLYHFMDDPSAFQTWVDLKLSFFVHMEAVSAFEQDLTEHSRDISMEYSRLKPILVQEPGADWASSLEKLRIIKTNTEIEETSLRIDFDVFNRDVQNFRKTDPPKPHFRVVCVDELSKFPSGAEVRAVHARHDDNVTTVFAVVGVGSVTYLQMNPKDLLPVYVGND